MKKNKYATPQSFWSNDIALKNTLSMSVTLETSHVDTSPLNGVSENMSDMSVTLGTSHFERSQLNNDACMIMPAMLVTLDTSHSERSPLSEVPSNMAANTHDHT